MLKRVLKILGLLMVIVLVLAVAGLATLNQTTPWLLKPVLGYVGATVENISSQDGEYTLTGLRWSDPEAGLSVEVKQATLPTPWRVITRKFFGRDVIVRVAAERVTVTQEAAAGPAPEDSEGGDDAVNLPELVRLGLDYWELAFAWIDRADAALITYRENAETIASIATLSVDADEATILGINAEDVSLTTRIERQADGLAIQVKQSDGGIRYLDDKTAFLEIQLPGESTLVVDGRFQAAVFNARWGAAGVVPEAAEAKASDFEIPADLVAVPGYQPPVVNFDAAWDGASAAVDLSATAKPAEENYPALDVKLQARGDVETVTVEQLLAQGWNSELRLSAPVTVQIDDLQSIPDAEFTADLDLGAIPVKEVAGRLNGTLRAQHREGEAPLVTAALSGSGLSYEGVTLESLELNAEADLPVITVSQLRATTAGGSTIAATAEVDIERETIVASSLDAELLGGILDTIAPLLPEAPPVSFERASVSLKASGPWLAPGHQGAINVTALKPPMIKPGDIDLAWEGDYLDFRQLTLNARSPQGEANLEASAKQDGGDWLATLQTMRIAIGDDPEITLESPAQLQYSESGLVRVESIDLKSTSGGELILDAGVEYPARGEVSLKASDISGQWLDNFLDEPMPFEVEVDRVNVDAKWDDGPLTSEMDIDLEVTPPAQSVVKIEIDATTDAEAITLTKAQAVQGNTTILSAAGGLPIAINPAEETPLALRPDTPIDFRLDAAPDDSELWNYLEDQLGFDFVRPVFKFAIVGDYEAPDGELQLTFDAIEMLASEDKNQLPRVTDAQLEARFSEARAELTRFKVFLAEQPLTANARLPMGRDAWRALIQDQAIPDWRSATGELNFTDVPVAAFADWLPDILRDDGDVSLTATLPENGRLQGSFDIDGVTTRPLAQLGAVNDINARFTLNDRVMQVEKAEAEVGGVTVTLGGNVTLADDWAPIYDLHVSGQEVPLVRTAGIILRASPDIQLVTDSERITTVKGQVTLNESFFTMDLTDIGRGGGGGVEGGAPGSPPYFSITEKPMADWRLQLNIQGDRFLRVGVPAFEGVVSSSFDLRGSLRNPFMYGQATMETGVVLFPFANLRMEQGVITISQNDPTTVKLDVLASGRAYGYDIDMRVGGTAESPEITFSSTPSLEQSDILLMITSGQIPDQARSTESKLSGIGMYIGNSFLADLGLIDPLDDTLTVTSGEDVTVSGKETITVRYKINDDWTVVGAYDKYDAYYLDLEWTIYED